MKAGPPLAVMVVGLLLAWGAPAWLDRLSGDALEHPVSGAEEIPSDRVLKAVSVTISPPAYTGLPESRAEDLDLQLPAGSKVSWALKLLDV